MPAEPLFSFGILADCQYADIPDHVGGTLERYYRRSPARLAAAVEEFNRHDLAFVVHLGDLIDQDLANIAVPVKVLAGARAPVRHLLGNHDFAGPRPGLVNNRADLLDVLGLSATYYRFDQPGWRLLLLDTNEVGVIEHSPGTELWQQGRDLLDRLERDGRVNANPWNGTLGGPQLSWLHNELDNAADHGLDAIVFAHHGLYPQHHDNILRDRELLAELVGHPNLRAWINGHNHAGAYGRAGALHCLTVRGMVETTTNAYALAQVYADHLDIAGFGREPSRTLSW